MDIHDLVRLVQGRLPSRQLRRGTARRLARALRRSPTRLGAESLETRSLLSATMPMMPTMDHAGHGGHGGEPLAVVLTAEVPVNGGGAVGPVVVGATPRTYAITWTWGETLTYGDFNPAADVLALDWFRGADLDLGEQGGSTVLAIPAMRQSYTLAGVPLSALGMSNFTFKDPSAGAYLSGVLIAAPAADPPPVVSQPAPTPVDGAVSFAITDDWGSGFNGQVTVTNPAAAATTGWRATFDFDGEIVNLWNGAITSRTGTTHVVSSASWNGGLASGGSTAFGFTARLAGGHAMLHDLRVEFSGGTAVPPAPTPVDPGPTDPAPADPAPGDDMPGHDMPVEPTPADPMPGHDHTMPPATGDFIDLATFGMSEGSDHTHLHELEGGRTPITTEALVVSNGLRAFFGLEAVDLETVGRWAYANQMTNNSQAWGNDLLGVGLYYAMQGAKVGWIRDAAFDPQILADIQRTARLGSAADALAMVEQFGHEGLREFLAAHGLEQSFVNTLKMEPHYAGWMHDRCHGWLGIEGVAIAHDLNHLTVLSHDQMRPFMNDTFDWPQWPALQVSHDRVIEYFQSMVVLGDPLGENLVTPAAGVPGPAHPVPHDPQPMPTEPVSPPPAQPPVDSGPGDPPPPPVTDPVTTGINYAEALGLSFLFYEANRSGDLDEATNRIDWRGDSSLTDGSDGVYFGGESPANLQPGLTLDLAGGYHDAGDHVKFGLPLASALSTLAWGGVAFADGYTASGQMDELLAAVKWGTDYLLDAQVTDAAGATLFFVAQVGNADIDHGTWGPPETLAESRPAMAVTPQRPGSDVAGGSAAALASASVLFRQAGDVTYADTLLDAAESLYAFADTYRGSYADSIPEVRTFYNSSGYLDELAYGAAWLARAREAAGQSGAAYRQQALSIYTNEFGGIANGWTHSWSDSEYGAAVLLAQDTGDVGIHSDVQGWLDSWVAGTNGVQITAGGLRFISMWGSLRYASNTALLASIYAADGAAGDRVAAYETLARTTVDYVLGDNPRSFSYMVGYGDAYPLQPHHSAASGLDGWGGFNNNQPNAHVLYGALVGGPKQADDFAYEDIRSDYIGNEVTLDYNAGLTGALAAMMQRYGGTPLTDAAIDALPGISVPAAVPGGAAPSPAPLPTPAPSPTPAPAPAPAPVDATVRLSAVGGEIWWGGLTVNLSFTNVGNTALENWTSTFVTPHEITESVWGLEVTAAEDLGGGLTGYTIRGAGYAAVLQPGSTVTVGFTARQGVDLGSSGVPTAEDVFDSVAS